MKDSFTKALHRFKTNYKLQDKRTSLIQIAKILVIVVAVLNLSYSQVHIEVITQIFNRLVGLVMFTFILFGLVSLFAITRIGHTTLPAIISVSINIILGIIYVYMLMNDVNTEVAVTMDTIIRSFAFSIGIITAYLAAIVLLVLGDLSRE